MGPLSWWDLPWTTASSLGVLDQPGYWPPEYIAASRAFLVILTAYLGYRAIFWPFEQIEG
jgi:hypothetical protein